MTRRDDEHAGALTIAAKEYGDLKMARDECERYAGRLEAACDHIRAVCMLAKSMAIENNDQWALETFDAIVALSRVRDDRSRL